jgi:prostaglandin-H2 D-isomerase / glutathione transferase
MVHYEKDEKVQAEKRALFDKELAPFTLKKLDEIAKENNGHLALKRLTWADLYFAAIKEYMSFVAKYDLTEKYGNLKKVVDNVMAIDSVKKWVEKRPKTDA